MQKIKHCPWKIKNNGQCKIAHAKIKKTAFTMQKLKKELNSQCKKHKEFALPMQKLKIICIVHANNKKDLHSQGQNYK